MDGAGAPPPPLYKEGKSLGIIEHFFLYAKLCINHNTLRHMKNFTDFTYKFFKVLKPYKKLREGLVGLNSILNIRYEDNYSKLKFAKPSVHVPNEAAKLLHLSKEPEDEDTFDNHADVLQDVSDEEYEKEYEPESHADVDTIPKGELENHENHDKPCKKLYEFGECTDRNCRNLHDKKAMTGFQDQILKNLIKSQFADPEEVFFEKARKLFFLKRNNAMYES